MVKRQPNALLWMGSAFCAALALAAGVLAVLGADARGTDWALRLTARLSFLLFWAAYSGSALVSIFGPAFQPVKRHGREFGLAFAAALLVHLGLVAWLSWIGRAPNIHVIIFFGSVAASVYLMALFSISGLQQALGPRFWRLIRIVGMNYVAYAFATDFLADPLSGGIWRVVQYLPFAFLAVAGPALRLTAFAQQVARRWSPPSASEAAPTSDQRGVEFHRQANDPIVNAGSISSPRG